MRSALSLLARCLPLVLLFLTQPAISGPLVMAAQESPSSTEDIANKLKRYIHCINRLAPRAHDSRDRYLSWCDEQSGPTGKERHIYGLYEIYPRDSCQKGILEAQQLSPSWPAMDKAAGLYIASADRLGALLKTIGEYYDQKDYQDDGMAQGQRLHGPLLAAYAELFKHENSLRLLIEPIQDQLDQRLNSQPGKSSADSGDRVQSLQRQAQTLSKNLLREGNLPVEKLDLQRFGATLERYIQLVSELEQESASNTRSDANVSAHKSLIEQAKYFKRELRDVGISSKQLPTLQRSFLRSYNQLADSLGRLTVMLPSQAPAPRERNDSRGTPPSPSSQPGSSSSSAPGPT